MQTEKTEKSEKYCPFNATFEQTYNVGGKTVNESLTVCGNYCAWYNNDKEECNFVTLSRNIQYIRKEICFHEIPNETHK